MCRAQKKSRRRRRPRNSQSHATSDRIFTVGNQIKRRRPRPLHEDNNGHWRADLTASLHCSLRAAAASDASIYRKYRFDIDISYRIESSAEISKFSIYRYRLFWYIVLPNFHVWCQEVVKFSLKFSLKLSSKLSLTVKVSTKVSMKISRLLDTIRENSIRESLNFSLWENFVKFYITT